MAVLRKRRSGTKNSHYEGIGGGKRGQGEEGELERDLVGKY